jgi:transcriptional regulator with XRE-family HTH domain
MTQSKSKARRTDGWIERAREQMTSQGLTYDDLAAPLDLSTRGGVSHYFNGRRELSAEQAVALAELFGCSLEWLLTGSQSATHYASVPEARRQPSPDELVVSLRQMRPEVYDIVTRMIAELAPGEAHSRGGRRGTPKR